MFDFLIEFNENRNRKELLIRDAKDILDRVLNSASHHNENPLHRTELKQAIEGIKNLKEHFECLVIFPNGFKRQAKNYI